VPSTTWLPASFRPLNRRVEEKKRSGGVGVGQEGGRGWIFWCVSLLLRDLLS